MVILTLITIIAALALGGYLVWDHAYHSGLRDGAADAAGARFKLVLHPVGRDRHAG